MLLALSSSREGPGPGRAGATHRQLLLQADAERLGVVGFQLLQGHSRLPDELVVAEFVLIAHGDPEGKGTASASATLGAPTWFQSRGVCKRWVGGGCGWGRCGGAEGGNLQPGPHPPQGLSNHVFVCDPVVSEGLVPRGVQRVPESFCSELICLERERERDKERKRERERGSSEQEGVQWAE